MLSFLKLLLHLLLLVLIVLLMHLDVFHHGPKTKIRLVIFIVVLVTRIIDAAILLGDGVP